MSKKDIYVKRVGAEVRFIELSSFDEAAILLVKKLRFQKVNEVPAISKGVKNVRELGIQELINPMKKRMIQLLEDPAWVVVLFDAVKKEEITPTLQKMYNN
ncbi:MAG TPA: hypothetical protein EYH36_06465 [Desulfocapsa sulfexigens]|nr:hypothetical protein [Desulfocapsa sulfexigens]